MAQTRLQISKAGEDDIPALAALRRDTARELTARYGFGHWSHEGSDDTVRRGMEGSFYLIGIEQKEIVAALRLSPSRPWAIDPSHFTPVRRPLYLTDMAVSPARQRSGLGRILLTAAKEEAIRLRAGAIRLDAYDAPAGAGEFYTRCGFLPRGVVVYRQVPLIYFELLLPLRPPEGGFGKPHWRFL